MASEPIAFTATFNVVPPDYLETIEARNAWAASVCEFVQSWIETDAEKYHIHFEHSPTDVTVRTGAPSTLWIVVKYPWMLRACNVHTSAHYTTVGKEAGLQPFYQSKTEAETACDAINALNPGVTRKLYGAVGVPNPY